jgi:hypothetical protein
MKLNMLLLSGSVAALMVAFSVPATAAMAKTCECKPGQATAASYTHDFKGEANTIFQAIQDDAVEAQDHADQLVSIAGDSNMSWFSDATQLEALKEEVDDMGTKVCRLETIRSVVAPWQQAEIDRLAVALRLMADNAEDAIVFGGNHQNELWLPTYQKYAQNLYHEASDLSHSASQAVAYANVSKEYRGLRHDLGVRASS